MNEYEKRMPVLSCPILPILPPLGLMIQEFFSAPDGEVLTDEDGRAWFFAGACSVDLVSVKSFRG